MPGPTAAAQQTVPCLMLKGKDSDDNCLPAGPLLARRLKTTDHHPASAPARQDVIKQQIAALRLLLCKAQGNDVDAHQSARHLQRLSTGNGRPALSHELLRRLLRASTAHSPLINTPKARPSRAITLRCAAAAAAAAPELQPEVFCSQPKSRQHSVQGCPSHQLGHAGCLSKQARRHPQLTDQMHAKQKPPLSASCMVTGEVTNPHQVLYT